MSGSEAPVTSSQEEHGSSLPAREPLVEASVSPTPTPLATIDVRNYFNLVAPDLSLLLVTLQRNRALLHAPAPARMEWRMEVSSGHSAITAGYDGLASVEPPPGAAELHGSLLAATESCIGIMRPLEGDLEHISAETFGVIADMIDLCSEEVIAIMDQIKRARAGR